MEKNKIIQSIVFVLICAVVWVLPSEFIPIDNLTTIEHRVIALFILAALFWIFEPIPNYATSILIIVLLLVTVSDRSFVLFLNPDDPFFGTQVKYQDIMATFASPINMLFLGGFFLAMASAKYKLDVNLVNVVLKPFGNKPKFVLLGIILTTALFSMFMSNTATTAMMMALLAPVVALLKKTDRGRVAFGLAIAFAANIGGIGTIIGTPPNAIGAGYLEGQYSIGFGQWTLFSLPFVIVMLGFLWFLLSYFYSTEAKIIDLKLGGSFEKSPKAIIVYITFILTILLWLLDFLHGMSSFIVAMIPVAVFSVLNILNKDDLKKISWDVLWLVAGGLALGLCLEQTGLASNIVSSIPLEDYTPFLIVAFAGVIAIFLSTFISNTATANLMLPIVLAIGAGFSGSFASFGMVYIVLTVTFACSLGMALPISTPPNALACGMDLFKTKDMIKTGLLIGAVGLFFAYFYLYFFSAAFFGGE